MTDVGIDMTVETVDKAPNGKFISIQIKSGKSFFNEKKVTYRRKDQHLKYWLNHSLPSYDNFDFDLRSINQKLQSKNVLESIYTITNYFDGLLVLPRNIISKLHPFKLENHSSA